MANHTRVIIPMGFPHGGRRMSAAVDGAVDILWTCRCTSTAAAPAGIGWRSSSGWGRARPARARSAAPSSSACTDGSPCSSPGGGSPGPTPCCRRIAGASGTSRSSRRRPGRSPKAKAVPVRPGGPWKVALMLRYAPAMARIPHAILQHFANVPLFSRVSKRGLRLVVSEADELDVPAGRDLVREGEYGRHLFVIVSGAARVHRKAHRIARLGPGARRDPEEGADHLLRRHVGDGGPHHPEREGRHRLRWSVGGWASSRPAWWS